MMTTTFNKNYNGIGIEINIVEDKLKSVLLKFEGKAIAVRSYVDGNNPGGLAFSKENYAQVLQECRNAIDEMLEDEPVSEEDLV